MLLDKKASFRNFLNDAEEKQLKTNYLLEWLKIQFQPYVCI